MYTVHKHIFPINDEFWLSLPEDAKILKVDVQHNIPTLWEIHKTDNTLYRDRKFRIVGTGHPILDGQTLSHIATFFMHDGDLVWHLFEEYVVNPPYSNQPSIKTSTETR